MNESDEELTEIIALALGSERSYEERVPESDPDRIAQVRACGRKAGRLLGRPVRTGAGRWRFQPDDDRNVIVLVTLVDEATEEEVEASHRRQAILVRHLGTR